MKPAWPFLLHLYGDYAGERLSRHDLVALTRLVTAYAMRRAVCGYKPAAPPPVFAKAPSAIEPDRYVESVRAHFLSLPDRHAFPSDDAFRAELTTRNMYRFRHRDAVLERLENHGRKETVSLASYTVDHIMPQGERLPEAWKAELGPDWAQVWHTWRHMAGRRRRSSTPRRTKCLSSSIRSSTAPASSAWRWMKPASPGGRGDPWRSEPFPPLDDYDALLAMGGPQQTDEEHLHPWLADEKALLREALARGLPVLGVCLGCQLLADAHGGRVGPLGAGRGRHLRLQADGGGPRRFALRGAPAGAARLAVALLCGDRAARARDPAGLVPRLRHPGVSLGRARLWRAVPHGGGRGGGA